jgi:hypothetical protein
MFACCDFRAVDGYEPQALDLYRAFDNIEYEMVTELHAYFPSKNYKTEVAIHAPFT